MKKLIWIFDGLYYREFEYSTEDLKTVDFPGQEMQLNIVATGRIQQDILGSARKDSYPRPPQFDLQER